MRRTSRLSGLVLGTLLGMLLPATAAASDAGAPQVFRFHGGGYDQVNATAVDATGNLYVAGSIDGGSTGFAVAKLSPAGATLWIAHYTGSLGGLGGTVRAVAVDDAGNVYAAGSISDNDRFYFDRDYLLVRFGPDGTQRWAQRFDGPTNGDDMATEVATDSAGNVYVSGFSYGQTSGQAYDWSTQKYSAAGALLWERRHSGPGTADDRPADMAFAPGGNLVVTGFVKRTGDGMTDDIDTVTYDPAGNLIWQRSWTDFATSHDTPAELDIDAAGRIAITGSTAEGPSPYVTPSPVTLRYDASGTLLQTIRGDGGTSVELDAAGDLLLAGPSSVARYRASGERVWSTPLTLGSDDALAPVSARADSTGAITVAGTVVNIFNHNQDYLVIRYAADGRELWRYRFNGPVNRNDRVAATGGVTIDGADNALVTGTSWNDYLSNRNGTADDIVTLRFAPDAAPALLAPSDLTATGISGSQIRLTWTDNAGTEDGFRIERCQGNGCVDFALVATVGHDVTAYTDSGLARNTPYTYRIRAFHAGGVSAYSNIARGKTRRN